MESAELHRPEHPVRIVTAAALFDGHDASINIMRRILQAQGAEVIHLGHNRSVREVVDAAVQEGAHGIAVSSYQGGHMEYFTYLVQSLAERGRSDCLVFGGGGGVITPAEIEELHARGVRRIFSPADGQKMGLAAMVNTIIRDCDRPSPALEADWTPESLGGANDRDLARVMGAIADATMADAQVDALLRSAPAVPVLGITGTGGSGKSSLTDELLSRLRRDQHDKVRVAVLAIDPTRRRAGGALLGDRIRMNCLDGSSIFFRSVATRGSEGEIPPELPAMVAACAVAGVDLVVIETPGIGQAASAVTDIADVSIYVMTPEFGAASQLEKIDMLDFADAVVINKFEQSGADDALRDVRRQVARNREAFDVDVATLPVFGTAASRFNDDGVTGLYSWLRRRLVEVGVDLVTEGSEIPTLDVRRPGALGRVLPEDRETYLADIATTVRGYHGATERWAEAVSRRSAVRLTADMLDGADGLTTLLAEVEAAVPTEADEALADLDAACDNVTAEARHRTSLSGLDIARISVPPQRDPAERLRFARKENLPGRFPFTAGVFPYKRDDEDPIRMFAGEGGPAKTNRRFHLLAEGQPAARLSTAFDSVTLYGQDPDLRPDIYGKVGNSGVSIATLDDMGTLYSGFDLCAPSTSVSMTINGPAPAILAMFLNTAIDQRRERFAAEHGRPPTDQEAADIAAWVLSNVRGTVQADILKEDQGQNTCIFSTEFALRMMADMQEWFIEHQVRRFYSVSISGYHIAEAGANPISQLAFTLSNGFTYVESYLARGLDIDDFAPNLSFFFSNGMDPEYTVLGRVARRIWAVAMRERYGAGERSQKLKYHIQTSGRSLHAQEMAFNDIRTTLQALCAIYDNCNSLHTNAYDEAVTTPTDESVRRAMAIQLIINREWGLAGTDNPLQGSFVVEELTDLVEAAVLDELDQISRRGGVLGAMESGYQRGRIQDESMLYEHRKHDGSLPLIGVNTFLAAGDDGRADTIELRRSDEGEKSDQLHRLQRFHDAHRAETEPALAALRGAAVSGGNTFAALMSAVRVCSLGQISASLFEVGGRYRRNM